MAFQANTPQLGIVNLTDVDTLAPGYSNTVAGTGSGRWPQLGSIVDGYDPVTLGGGKFIYLKGYTACVAGIVVQWDSTLTAASLVSTANSGRPIAVALVAVTGSQYGWFQIQGRTTVLKTAVAIAPDQRVWISATAGRLFSTSTAGKQVLGARTANAATIASATSTITVYLQFPHVQGQIT